MIIYLSCKLQILKFYATNLSNIYLITYYVMISEYLDQCQV